MTTEFKGITLAVLSAILYGSLPIIGLQITATGLSIESMLFWRFLLSFLLLACFFPKSVFVVNKLMLWNFLFAVTGYVISSFFYFKCAEYIGTGLAMTVFFVYPMILALLNYVLLKETLPFSQKLGMLFAFSALLFLTDFKFHYQGDVFMGFVLGIIGGAGYAVYVFLTRATGLKAITLTAWVCLGSATFFGVHSITNHTFVLPPLSLSLELAELAIIGTVLPIIFFIKAVNLIGTIKTSLVSILEPATTLTFGMLFLAEQITWVQSTGLLLMIVSLFILEGPGLFKKKLMPYSTQK
ncbi:MAG: DMT family transporter [Candidatus Paracaedibacteraceae bacterium]|nr:DMT family transporter [Candidatus Paracaedibacteraceae bacterium]